MLVKRIAMVGACVIGTSVFYANGQPAPTTAPIQQTPSGLRLEPTSSAGDLAHSNAPRRSQEPPQMWDGGPKHHGWLMLR